MGSKHFVVIALCALFLTGCVSGECKRVAKNCAQIALPEAVKQLKKSGIENPSDEEVELKKTEVIRDCIERKNC